MLIHPGSASALVAVWTTRRGGLDDSRVAKRRILGPLVERPTLTLPLPSTIAVTSSRTRVRAAKEPAREILAPSADAFAYVNARSRQPAPTTRRADTPA